MKRSLIFAALAAVVMTVVANNLDAGWRSRWCCLPQPTYCAPVPSSAAAMAPSTQPQASRGYQSFSYEPAVPTTTAPRSTVAPGRSPSNSLFDAVRGDRKARGF